MKNLKITISALAVAALMYAPVYGQQIDKSRIEWDIKIMKSVLNELFKTDSYQPAFLSLFTEDNSFVTIEGDYLPGIGMYFSANLNNPLYGLYKGEKKMDEGKFVYGGRTTLTEEGINEETVVSRINKFFTEYAPSIGQLSPGERVILRFGSASNQSKVNTPVVFYFGNKEIFSAEKKQNNLFITASAAYSDLQSLRSGKISENEFKKKIQISTQKPALTDDYSILADILEKNLNNGISSLSISNRVDFNIIEQLGVLYRLDIRFKKNSSISNPFRIEFGTLIDKLSSTRDSLKIIRDSLKTTMTDVAETQADFEKQKQKFEEEKERRKEEEAAFRQSVRQDYEKLKEDLIDCLVDYGRTLKSMPANQNIIISTRIDSDIDIPEKLILQVNKSVLNDLNDGKISRKKAVDRISVSEF